jgi:hypothetical protein
VNNSETDFWHHCPDLDLNGLIKLIHWQSSNDLEARFIQVTLLFK